MLNIIIFKIINKFFEICKNIFKLKLKEIPENPGFFILSLIGFFGILSPEHIQIFKYGSGLNGVLFGVGFWGITSSSMMRYKDNVYWVNIWIICHFLKSLFFMLMSYHLIIKYSNLQLITIYCGLMLIDLIIIRENLKTRKFIVK